MHIERDDLTRASVQALIQEHVKESSALSPPESMFALGVEALRSPQIELWTAWSHQGCDVLLGCVALKTLNAREGEIKSMRTPAAQRRRGAGRALMRHLIDESRRRGFDRLWLETGSQPAFAPARALYASLGFEVCGPFSGYEPDPLSVFMTLSLSDQTA